MSDVLLSRAQATATGATATGATAAAATAASAATASRIIDTTLLVCLLSTGHP
jgi:hypothetical protein